MILDLFLHYYSRNYKTLKVLKFGGSSVGTPERINSIIDILQPRIASGDELTVVFSAFSGVTDSLIAMSENAAAGKTDYIAMYEALVKRHNDAITALMGDDIYLYVKAEMNDNYETLMNLLKGISLVREISPRTMDYVLSFGERNSNFIIAETMKKRGFNAAYLDARKVIKTNKDFGSAKVNFELTNDLVAKHYATQKGTIQIVTGFIASDVGGLTTTLGRGGSDYTAAILAGALNAEVLEIWTDVDGVLTCDPRKVKKAFTLPSLSYAEAMEMSHFGAKVIYPPTIQPALKKNIPIYIKNTFNPTFVGTLIDKEVDTNFPTAIKGISSLSGVALLRLQGTGMVGVPGVSARLFGAIGQAKINIILITQASSEHSICIAVLEKEASHAKQVIEAEFSKEIESLLIDPVMIENELAIVAVVGEGMRAVPGVAGKLFESLGKNGINITAIAQGSSELNISFVIQKKDESKALNLIHDSFFLSDNRRVNLFIVGVGLIGNAFLNQIQKQRQQLIDKYKLEINVVGLSNSKKMIFNEDGIDLSIWKKLLDDSTLATDIPTFVNTMKSQNLSNSIFIDNTADTGIPKYYKEILNSNISLVTPNKIATSASNEEYKALKKIAADKKIHFKYETNVGAGLPLISTIQSLINSGDRILKIEAVMSGSISYIFNNFTVDKKFSDLVFQARTLGYTEPDPRDDLSGADVRRKVIILTRESGHDIESGDVVLEPILPQALMDIEGIDPFLEALPQYDDYFSGLIKAANDEGKVLRFIGSTEDGKAKVAIQAVASNNPFYSLEGSDNMFVITTERYHDRPIVIKGPGAGAEVTAAGVFGDVLMICS
jgi:bifunctional aspartokinase / homoserine dehydrogenase 1